MDFGDQIELCIRQQRWLPAFSSQTSYVLPHESRKSQKKPQKKLGLNMKRGMKN